MTRRLVPLRRIVREMEEQGEDPDVLFVDPDDVVEAEEDEDETDD